MSEKELHPAVKEKVADITRELEMVLGPINDALLAIAEAVELPEDTRVYLSAVGGTATIQVYDDSHGLSEEEQQERLETIVRGITPLAEKPWRWSGGDAPYTTVNGCGLMLIGFVSEECIFVETAEMAPVRVKLCGEAAIQHREAQEAGHAA